MLFYFLLGLFLDLEKTMSSSLMALALLIFVWLNLAYVSSIPPRLFETWQRRIIVHRR
jgi:hypothetical protein